MTTSLEKTLFIFVYKNREYIHQIEPTYFKNTDIRRIFSVLKEYVEERPSASTPEPKQLYEMVKMKYQDNPIEQNIFKLIFKTDLEKFDVENFLKPSLGLFISTNKLKEGADEIIEQARKLDNVNNIDQMEEIANIIRETAISSTKLSSQDDDDLGSDFDDAEKHVQDHSTLRVPTGLPSLDSMLGGGLDRESLCILMGATNSGKSLWLQNISANIANSGYNVVYFTLEMSEKKVLKRIGAMRLRIPINEYDKKSMNVEFMQDKIKQLKRNSDTKKSLDIQELWGDGEVGKINVRNFATGTATITHLDNYLEKLKRKKDFKIDAIIIDYLTLMAPLKGLGVEGNLYMKGKHLAESIRALGQKHNAPIISAMQVSKDAWNANDITLDKIPESKAIAETADTFFAIIRTEEMKRESKYNLKLLKQRDGDFSRSLAAFDLNETYLTIENDQIIL